MFVRRSAAVATAAAMAGGLIAGAAPASAAAASGRIAGDSRVATAVAISAFQFPAGARATYLARADVPADALAAGVLTDGPILLVPRCGSLPLEVERELNRLKPTEVVALGGTGAVCDELLAEAATGRARDRLAGTSRYETSAVISRRAFPGGAAEAYIASGANTSPDAVAGGTLTKGPLLLVPTGQPVPVAIAAEVTRLNPGKVIALGGQAAVPDAALAQAASGRPTGRYAGSSRFETAVAISQAQFPDGAGRAFIARADVFADAVAGGSLTRGPVLLVPSCGSLPAPVAAEISRLKVTEVFALGGTAAVCDAMLASAAAQGPPGPVFVDELPVVSKTNVTASQFGVARMDGLLWDESLLINSGGTTPGAIVLDLSRDYSRFKTTLGLQDDVDAGTLYRVEILGDDRSLGVFDLTGPGRQVPVDLDVANVLRLTLRVTVTASGNSAGLDVVFGTARVLATGARDSAPVPRETTVAAAMTYLYDLAAVDGRNLNRTAQDVEAPTNGKRYLHSSVLDSGGLTAAYRTYDLQRDFARFRTVLGLHDTNAVPGSRYRVSIVTDGTELFTDELTLGESHALDLDVTGRLRLTVNLQRLDSTSGGGLDVVLGSARALTVGATDSAPAPQ